MYQFRDLTAGINESSGSSVAMTWNGSLLEDIVPGYQTLNVEGRGLVDNHLSFYPSVSGRDGDIISSETVKSRYLIIQYEIKANDSQSLRLAYNKLNEALRNDGPVALSFADEPEYTFYGRFADAVEPDPATNNPVGYYRIFCEDPYKYGRQKELSEIEGVGFPLYVDRIEFSMPSSAEKITIRNETTGRRIILNGNYSSGQVIKIEGGKITKNGQNIKNNLDYIESDWHQFRIRAGDVISTTPTTTPMIWVRRRLL